MIRINYPAVSITWCANNEYVAVLNMWRRVCIPECVGFKAWNFQWCLFVWFEADGLEQTNNGKTNTYSLSAHKSDWNSNFRLESVTLILVWFICLHKSQLWIVNRLYLKELEWDRLPLNLFFTKKRIGHEHTFHFSIRLLTGFQILWTGYIKFALVIAEVSSPL